MNLLDLFCGAGGAAMGYHQAGFDGIVGVDIVPQPNYPFDFIQADALNPAVNFEAFDLVHASPPCQAYSTQGRWSRWGTPPSSPPLIAETQTMLDTSAVPFVIENVPGARRHLREPMVKLRGGMFGLVEIDRLRYFELGGWFYLQGTEVNRRPTPGTVKGVYGRAPDGRRLGPREDSLRAVASVEDAQRIMGMPWCDDWRGIAEAIPPAYTRFIGEQFLAQQ